MSNKRVKVHQIQVGKRSSRMIESDIRLRRGGGAVCLIIRLNCFALSPCSEVGIPVLIYFLKKKEKNTLVSRLNSNSILNAVTELEDITVFKFTCVMEHIWQCKGLTLHP